MKRAAPDKRDNAQKPQLRTRCTKPRNILPTLHFDGVPENRSGNVFFFKNKTNKNRRQKKHTDNFTLTVQQVLGEKKFPTSVVERKG